MAPDDGVPPSWSRITLRHLLTHTSWLVREAPTYGFGWELAPFRGLRRVQHAGSMPGFRSNYFKLPDERLTIILLTNAEDVDRDGILAGLASRLLPAARLR